MKEIDLSTVRVVENEIQTLLEPYLESQEKIQAFVDGNQVAVRAVASAFEDMTRTVETVQNALSFKAVQEAVDSMQTITKIAEVAFKLPDLSGMLPMELGHLYVDVLEEKEVVTKDKGPIALFPVQEKQSLAVMVADEIESRGLLHGQKTKPQQKLLAGSEIRSLAVLPVRDEDQVVVIVNDDYATPITRNLNKSWDTFLRAVEGEVFSFSQHRGVWDYFNYNVRCPLYTRTKRSLTSIFGQRLGKAVLLVDVELITPQKYTRQRNLLT